MAEALHTTVLPHFSVDETKILSNSQVSKHVPPESVELSYNGKVLITKGTPFSDY